MSFKMIKFRARFSFDMYFSKQEGTSTSIRITTNFRGKTWGNNVMALKYCTVLNTLTYTEKGVLVPGTKSYTVIITFKVTLPHSTRTTTYNFLQFERRRKICNNNIQHGHLLRVSFGSTRPITYHHNLSLLFIIHFVCCTSSAKK